MDNDKDRGDVCLSSRLSAFLSASAEQGDREIVEWFSNLLKKFNIEPVFAPDRPEPRPPQEKIEDFIRKSDIFIAVVTRRDRIRSKKTLWKGPVWVQNEIAMAHVLRKPIAVFAEENVQLEPSIVPFITDCVHFDRRALNSIRKKAENYIEALCKKITSHGSPQVEDKAVDETVVQDTEESAFSTAVTRAGRAILLWRYGKVNVSLRTFYIFATIATLVLSYIGYDSLFGTKTLGPTVASVALAAAIILVMSALTAWNSRCGKCKSYFSRAEAPVTYGDIKKFPNLPPEKRVVKHVCRVCGDTTYSTREKED